jgi:hypothetical protein
VTVAVTVVATWYGGRVRARGGGMVGPSAPGAVKERNADAAQIPGPRLRWARLPTEMTSWKDACSFTSMPARREGATLKCTHKRSQSRKKAHTTTRSHTGAGSSHVVAPPRAIQSRLSQVASNRGVRPSVCVASLLYSTHEDFFALFTFPAPAMGRRFRANRSPKTR